MATVHLIDALIAELDNGLRTLAAPAQAARPSPAAGVAGATLSADEQASGAALMRVNHAGEVAAQALYRGQAFTTRDPGLRRNLLDAARDEQDHLAWCAQRVNELGSRTSLLGPLWYAGSFALGAAAGLLGKATGLGFVVETERQVEEHLSGHLDRLAPADLTSRAIVQQMRTDEVAHGTRARELGGAELPGPVRRGMRLVARVMTTLAHRL
ncbi:MAG: 2-polyprenyl-3-methyl-6-methoxy-1,4-benzoquinone monooxygenase [Gammaproteobacteria bacterium]|nr:2-polyprenyl-3-methyl-6-methoxy-1,4-benzoquinone monooxygenase [Gammaproteobacteria bacterium]